MMLLEHQRLWSLASGGHFHTQKQDLHVAPGQWISRTCIFVTCSCPPAKLGFREGGKSGSAVHSQGERQEWLSRQFVLNPALCWDGRQDEKSSPDKDCKEVLWLNNLYKPAWVDGQPDTPITGPARPTSNPTLQDNPGLPEEGVTAQTVSNLCEKAQLIEAVDALSVLVRTGSSVTTSLLYTVLKRCVVEKNLVQGRRVHRVTVKLGYESNSFLGNHILRMYAAQGRLDEAMDVFTRVGKPDAFMWFSIISAHAKHGKPSQAIQLYHQVRTSDLKPDGHIFVAALQACAMAGDLESGRQVHTDVLESGIPPNSFVCTSLVDMYGKCGKCEDARRVFDSLETKDVATWNAMISGYAEHGLGEEALALYATMRHEGLIVADHFTFSCLLRACGSVGALQQGKQLHSEIVERGQLEGNIVVGNCLVDMYAKCGALDEARRVFDSLATMDVVTWTTMIAAYAEHGLGQEALALYSSMEQEDLTLANGVTFACLLKACAGVGALQQGKELHSQILERGQLAGDTLVGTCLVDMYAKCGQLEVARTVFDTLAAKNVVTWNAMIAGYADHGLGQEALALYSRMEHNGLVSADKVTFSCLLKACASVGALQQGKQLHSQILERGQLKGDVVVGTCLVDMYAKCGELEVARTVFDGLATKDVVAWNAMIAAYAEHGLGQEALALYASMEQERPTIANSATFAGLLKACASAGALNQGRQLHSQILEKGLLQGDVVLGSCLVDMYAKCGNLEDSRRVFDGLTRKNVVAWNAMISGYGRNNQGRKAIACFEEMLLTGVQPDDATFTCLVVACSHEGLVDEGRQYFNTMVKQHGLVPNVEHYNCMVDLLGRAGHLDAAENMMLSFQSSNDYAGWMSLLNACKSHGDTERGARCFERLVRLDPQHASAYVFMANIYADAGRWADVDRIETLRKSAGASKKPAVAGIEVNKQVRTFVVGEKPDDISGKVHSMSVHLKEEGGHLPNTTLVLKPLSEKEKEDQLCGHAEKLALAYGLLNTPNGSPLLVTKNLRMCRDCHTSTEIMSRIQKRHIVVRDAYRVHRFEGGSCTCKGRP